MVFENRSQHLFERINSLEFIRVLKLTYLSIATLCRDALWSIQVKTLFTSRYRWRNIAMNVFLVTMGICQSIF